MRDVALVAGDLSEPLVSFDGEKDAANVRDFMSHWNYDVLGVRESGVVVGCVEREELHCGLLADFMIPLEAVAVVDKNATLPALLTALHERGWLFISVRDHPWGIVTWADVEKVPMRMYLFALTSFVEMEMARLVEHFYPQDGWQEYLSRPALKKARRIFEERVQSNTEINLVQCTQFFHKIRVLRNAQPLLDHLGVDGQRWTAELEELNTLRNHLAHSNGIASLLKPNASRVVRRAHDLVEALRHFPTAGTR